MFFLFLMNWIGKVLNMLIIKMVKNFFVVFLDKVFGKWIWEYDMKRNIYIIYDWRIVKKLY